MDAEFCACLAVPSKTAFGVEFLVFSSPLFLTKAQQVQYSSLPTPREIQGKTGSCWLAPKGTEPPSGGTPALESAYLIGKCNACPASHCDFRQEETPDPAVGRVANFIFSCQGSCALNSQVTHGDSTGESTFLWHAEMGWDIAFCSPIGMPEKKEGNPVQCDCYMWGVWQLVW